MKSSSWGKKRQRFVLAFLLTILVIQFFPLVSYAQNLGAAPATGQAVQGQTAAQPENSASGCRRSDTGDGHLARHRCHRRRSPRTERCCTDIRRHASQQRFWENDGLLGYRHAWARSGPYRVWDFPAGLCSCPHGNRWPFVPDMALPCRSKTSSASGDRFDPRKWRAIRNGDSQLKC